MLCRWRGTRAWKTLASSCKSHLPMSHQYGMGGGKSLMQKSREDTDALNVKGFRGTWKTTAQTAVQEWMVRVMTDYIKREDTIKAIESETYRHDYLDHVIDIIEDIPSADVAPVRHGRWINCEFVESGFKFVRCSECNHDDMRSCLYKYCPNCGARMDGEK